jgi:hypothetical protein
VALVPSQYRFGLTAHAIALELGFDCIVALLEADPRFYSPLAHLSKKIPQAAPQHDLFRFVFGGQLERRTIPEQVYSSTERVQR